MMQDESAMLCQGSVVTGRGNVWRGSDPGRIEQRDLPCLAGDGRLHGHFVKSLTTSLDEIASRIGKVTESFDHRFLYEIDDPRLNEVEAYYVTTHMANWILTSLEPLGEYAVVVEQLGADEIFLDFDRFEVESRQLCYQLIQGMQGLEGAVLNVDVFAHEFAHHLVFSLNRQIGNSMLHEGLADYLAAAFTQDSVIEPSAWAGLDRDVQNQHKAPEDILTKENYCRLILDRLAQSGMYASYPSLTSEFTKCLDQDPGTLQAPEPHWAGMILSSALWELREKLGEDVFHPILFKAVSATPLDGTVDLLSRLLEADSALTQGSEREILQDSFSKRGLAQNLSLSFPRIGFPDCP